MKYYVQPENKVSFYVEKNIDNYEITSECPFTNVVNEIDEDEITHVVPEIKYHMQKKKIWVIIFSVGYKHS